MEHILKRRKSGGSTIYDLDISIHALLAESDRRRVDYLYAACKFLSTLSLRRATDFISPANLTYEISIHALLAESDAARVRHERRGRISIHALLAESDTCTMTAMPTGTYFYPRSPCGERRKTLFSVASPSMNFYPRSPCGERRMPQQLRHQFWIISIHALLAESDNGFFA